MRPLKGIFGWVAIILVCCIAASCNVEEDETECVVDVKLGFHFTRNGHESFGQDVPSLSVFVFDENGKYAGRWDENDNTRFGEGYTMTVPLMPDVYTFVAWGGLKDDNYHISSPGLQLGQGAVPVAGQTAMADMTVRLKVDTRNSYSSERNYVDYIPTAMYFGSASEVKLDNKKENVVLIDLVKNYKKINLTVTGLPDPGTRADAYPNLEITMDSPNGAYDFWNGLERNGHMFTYVLHGKDTPVANTQTSEIHTLRLLVGEQYGLTIYDAVAGKEIYTADLLEDCIRKVPAYNSQEGVDAEDEFDITLDMLSPLGVEVTVNGWNVGMSGNIIQ